MKDFVTFLQETGDDLEMLTSREDQLLALRQYGDYLDPMDPALKTQENYVPGCASATHVYGEIKEDGTLFFQGNSESLISKGYIYILIEAFNGCTPEQLMKEAEPHLEVFAQKANARLSMIASRANIFERVFRFMQKKTIEALARQGES